MAKNWDALVLNDYEAVMPLTWNKKYGICYLYQPPFTACLGITGKLVTTATMTDFLKPFQKNLPTGIFILTMAIIVHYPILICTKEEI